MTSKAPQVVIVGAGPTGVTAATLLSQYGIRCLVLDRFQSVYPQPRAVHLDDEICRIIARLGVAKEFAEISRPTLGLRLLDRNMRVLAEFHRDPDAGVHGFPQANMFDQPELEDLLRANLHRYAPVRGNVEVIGIAEVDGGRVRVTYADTVSGDHHVVEAKYVLGCDGANSIVRSAIGAKMRDLRFTQRWLIVDIATSASLHQWDGVHQVCDPVRAGTYMRIGATRYRWEFRLLPGETAADYQSIADLRALIAPWVCDVPVGEMELVRVTEYTFRAQLADRWRRGNICILGDAAHLTPPFIGQGMGAGVRDAMNLAWKLAGVLDGGLPANILDTYERERKPHARHMIRMARWMGWAMTAGGEAGNLIRRVIVPRMHLIPGLRTKILDSTTPALRRSALIARTRLGGRLCPNAQVAQGRRLDDVIGHGFALVTLEPLEPRRDDELARRGVAVVTPQPDSELTGWLRRSHVNAAIVRPDRTVMRAGSRVSALADAMPEFRSGTRFVDA